MCGIFGILNNEKHKFDYKTFCSLGIINDSRGGDSCGVFIDGEVEYGVNDKKLFSSFFKNSELINKTSSCNIALGHCRKASVGAINEKNAQPVTIKDENGNIQFVLIHNGTILNYEYLAKKYIPNIDINKMTDSQVLANIIFNCGYDCLNEYDGGAAFVSVDYRGNSPICRLFKGESKETQYSIKSTEERPLYFAYNGNSVYFSSIYSLLNCISKKVEAFTLSSNRLFYINEDGHLRVEMDFPERYTRVQKYSTSYYRENYYSSLYDFDDYYNTSYNKNKTTVKQSKCEIKSVSSSKDTQYIRSDDKGNYLVGTKKCHGKLFANQYGRIVKEGKEEGHAFWFWDGILLYNKDCFKAINEIYKTSAFRDYNDFYSDWPEVIRYLSPDPYCDDGFKYHCCISPYQLNSNDGEELNKILFNGNIIYLFSCKKISVRAGLQVLNDDKVNFCTEYLTSFNYYIKLLDNCNINVKELIDTIDFS